MSNTHAICRGRSPGTCAQAYQWTSTRSIEPVSEALRGTYSLITHMSTMVSLEAVVVALLVISTNSCSSAISCNRYSFTFIPFSGAPVASLRQWPNVSRSCH